MSRVFALIDCNNYYCSVEQIFRPDLKGKAICVLSNNDGCCVARNREAKQLGIKMGTPAFELKDLIRSGQLIVFSSNYALYADISNRVMSTLEEFAPCEPYSVDEAFLTLDGIAPYVALEEFGRQIQERIRKWIGIGVGVGISTTKTLAKLANRAAKDYPATGGVVDLTDRERQKRLMKIMPVSEVWGVGSRLTKRLALLNIKTALDLANANPRVIRKQFSVTLERTVMELNGIACFELEESPAPKKLIITSKSFGERVTELSQMREAVCSYTARACEKLRQEQQTARVVSVFISTSPFASDPYYSNSASTELAVPSDDTRDFLEAADRLLKAIWKPGYRYAKAGIMLADFYKPGVFQPGLFDKIQDRPNSTKLMGVLDRINQSHLGKVWFAGQGIGQGWSMKRRFLSPAYTTRWEDIPKVR